MFQDRFNLASADRNLLVEDVPAGPAPHAVGGPYAGAWRNYIKTVFKKGFMHKLSCKPSAHFYVAENKTLAGKEDRAYDGEALGRKLAVVFFEAGPGGLFSRVNQETLGMHQELLTLAELLQTVGGIGVPLDPSRTVAQTGPHRELLPGPEDPADGLHLGACCSRGAHLLPGPGRECRGCICP